MEGMRENARSYYERACQCEKKSIIEFFRKLDVNRDEKISLHECKKSMSWWVSAEAVYEKLDVNSDGSLDFNEFLCLYYINHCEGWQQREMEELHKIAEAYYEAGSPEVRDLAYKFFKSMDKNGDERVNRFEFLEFMRNNGYSHGRTDYFFDELDHDGDGYLDFSEVKTLYYIIRSGRPFCGCCKKFLPGTFFSCVDCFNNPPHYGTSFDLCPDCFRSGNFHHYHYPYGHRRSVFLDNYTLLQARRVPALAQASGVNWSQATNAIVPVPQNYMYVHNTTNHTYNYHSPNAIVPAAASKWEICNTALQAFQVTLGVGTISGCTIL